MVEERAQEVFRRYLFSLIHIALEKYGNNWTKVQLHVKTRSSAQIRSHAQKYKLKMMYDEAQEKFKTMKEEDRFFFKIVKAKKRNQKKPDTNVTSSSLTSSKQCVLFEVEKNNNTHLAIPESYEEDKQSSQSSDRPVKSPPTKKRFIDYSFTKKIFAIVKGSSSKKEKTNT